MGFENKNAKSGGIERIVNRIRTIHINVATNPRTYHTTDATNASKYFTTDSTYSTTTLIKNNILKF